MKDRISAGISDIMLEAKTYIKVNGIASLQGIIRRISAGAAGTTKAIPDLQMPELDIGSEGLVMLHNCGPGFVDHLYLSDSWPRAFIGNSVAVF